jgi:hypothetical protein
VLYPLQKFGKWQKKVFLSIELMRVAPDLFGHSLYKGQIFFCHNVDLLGIKNAEFYVEFKNINFP